MPYYNAGIVRETLTIPAGGAAQTEVDCYSFGPLPGPMALDTLVGAGSPLQFAFDRKSCTNGDKVTMTVSVKQGAPRGPRHYTLLASLGKESAHYWRGLVNVQ